MPGEGWARLDLTHPCNCMTMTWKCPSVEGEITIQRLSFSSPKFRYRLKTNWMRWKKRDKVWSSANALFKRRFCSCGHRCCVPSREHVVKLRKKTRLSAQPLLWNHANKPHFHKKGCALGLVLKVKVFGSRKWLICCPGLGHLYLLFNAPPWGIFSFSKTKLQMPDKCPGGGNGHAWNWLSHKCSRVWLCVSFRRKT